MRLRFLLAASAALSGCVAATATGPAPAPVTVKIVAFNDFHGNLEPPRQAIPTEEDTPLILPPR
jgi:5'-nucleotidase